jgi:hypothetical protein
VGCPALPPKAALHARYLLKLITSRGADLKIIVGLWTNNKPGAVEANDVQTVTSLDALHKQFDQITTTILLGKAATPQTIGMRSCPRHELERGRRRQDIPRRLFQ